MSWRFLYQKAPAEFLLATEEVLTRSVGGRLSPPTIRLNVFSPAAVLVGRHQSLNDEVDVEAALRMGYAVNRRCSGGGAIIMGDGSPGWEVWIPQDFVKGMNMEEVYRRYSEPIVNVLRALGLNASFRAKNDIEVNGRKISGMGVYSEEGGLLICGTILLELDAAAMLRVLKISPEKLSDKAVRGIEERVTSVKGELGYKPSMSEVKELFKEAWRKELGVELEDGSLTDWELKDLEETIKIYKSAEWVYGERAPDARVYSGVYVKKTRGGLFRIYCKVYGEAVENVMITGDFFVHPHRALLELEAMLKWAPLDEEYIRGTVAEVFSRYGAQVVGLAASDVADILCEALISGRAQRY